MDFFHHLNAQNFLPHQLINACEWYLKWRNPHICFSSMDTASLWKGIPKPRTASLIPVRYLPIRYLNPWQPLGPLLKVQLLVGPTCKIPQNSKELFGNKAITGSMCHESVKINPPRPLPIAALPSLPFPHLPFHRESNGSYSWWLEANRARSQESCPLDWGGSTSPPARWAQKTSYNP